MAEKWRRCGQCRKVKAVEEFDGEAAICVVCSTPVVRRAPRAGGPVTTSRVAPAAGSLGGSVGGSAGGAATVRTTPITDLRGRGDAEVRARRARVRALDRLAEQFPEDFEVLLAQERRAEGL